MSNRFRINGNQNKVIFLTALLTGLAVSLAVKPEVVITMLELTTGDQYPLYAVMVWEVDRGECRFYDTEQLLPRGYENMFDNNPQECAEFGSQMLRRRLELINQTTNSREVIEVVEESQQALDNREYDKADEIASRIQVNRTYTVN